MRQIILAFLFIIGGAISVIAQSVYVTNTGTKYHKESCFHLNESKKELELKKAKTLDYSPCTQCKPVGYKLGSSIEQTPLKTVSKKLTAVQCSGKTKSGSRCKRKTINSSGRCYQH